MTEYQRISRLWGRQRRYAYVVSHNDSTYKPMLPVQAVILRQWIVNRIVKYVHLAATAYDADSVLT